MCFWIRTNHCLQSLSGSWGQTAFAIDLRLVRVSCGLDIPNSPQGDLDPRRPKYETLLAHFPLRWLLKALEKQAAAPLEIASTQIALPTERNPPFRRAGSAVRAHVFARLLLGPAEGRLVRVERSSVLSMRCCWRIWFTTVVNRTVFVGASAVTERDWLSDFNGSLAS